MDPPRPRTRVALLTIAAMSFAAPSAAVDIATDIDSFVTERATAEQRRHAAESIRIELARRVAGTARIERYRMPNVDPLLDFLMPPMRGQNVVWQLPATIETDRNIILGAHYDSEPGSPGADDNASGVYALIDIAERLAALPERTANITIVWFDQEEEDMVGSTHFAKTWRASGKPLHSMHNVDMIGYDGDGDAVVELDIPNEQLAAPYMAAARELGIPINRVTYDSTDHVAFRQLGYDAMAMSEEFAGGDFNPNHHAPGDTVIDRAYMARATELMARALETLVTQ